MKKILVLQSEVLFWFHNHIFKKYTLYDTMALYFWCDNLGNDKFWKWQVVTFGKFFFIAFLTKLGDSKHFEF